MTATQYPLEIKSPGAIDKIAIGDRIKFRVVCRDGQHTATRKVIGLFNGRFEVGFWTVKRFEIGRLEVLEHYPQ